MLAKGKTDLIPVSISYGADGSRIETYRDPDTGKEFAQIHTPWKPTNPQQNMSRNERKAYRRSRLR